MMIDLDLDLCSNLCVCVCVCMCVSGGATLNSIRVAQWMLQTPGSTTYFGAIGNDKFGDTLGQKSEHLSTIITYK
jgi:sugar/nucleoside kinase (ribokinase family)